MTYCNGYLFETDCTGTALKCYKRLRASSNPMRTEGHVLMAGKRIKFKKA